MRLVLAALSAIAALAAGAKSHAHESRPLYIEITETAPGDVSLKWITPASVAYSDMPTLSLGPPCERLAGAQSPARQGAQRYRCDGGPGGVRVEIAYPLFQSVDHALARVAYADGRTQTAVLDPSKDVWEIPAEATFAALARSYLTLGVEHILGGVDHLLFLTGLLFIASDVRRTIVTVTGFTLAHSLTLIATALDIVRVSVPATEAVIALSIVFLASEIARGDRTTLAWRRPALVASTFGLVHGAGFAAALGEIGLPQTEKVGALLFFNLGVELGQLGVVALVFAVILALKTFAASAFERIRDDARIPLAAAYALGVVSAAWFIERAARALTPA
ncbi:MAG: HupE/UreJ family protein [Parvularculaceae bacterium]